MYYGSKRFTKNDLSWLLPDSKSHQSGINLPLSDFEKLFPEITRMEYDMKDQLIRQTIMSTQDDVKEIKDQMIRVEEKIDKLK